MVALGGVAVLLLTGDVGLPAGANLPLGVGLMLIGVTLAALRWSVDPAVRETPPVSDLALPQFLAGPITATVVAAFAGQIVSVGNSGAMVGPPSSWRRVSTVLPFLAFLAPPDSPQPHGFAHPLDVVPVIGVNPAACVFLEETLTLSLVAGGILLILVVVLIDRASERLRIAAIGAP